MSMPVVEYESSDFLFDEKNKAVRRAGHAHPMEKRIGAKGLGKLDAEVHRFKAVALEL